MELEVFNDEIRPVWSRHTEHDFTPVLIGPVEGISPCRNSVAIVRAAEVTQFLRSELGGAHYLEAKALGNRLQVQRR